MPKSRSREARNRPSAASLLPICLLFGCAAWPASAQGIGDPLADSIGRFVSERGDSVERIEIGRSLDGRPLVVLRAGEKDAPALLLVGGVDGRLRAAPSIALAALGALLDDPAMPLAKAAIYVVPGLDPDGYARAHAQTADAKVAGPLRKTDDDRDGWYDEDAPTDVDGNGAVTWMRVFDPKPPLQRTHIVDPADSRKSKAAERAKGEVPTFALVREARDLDGDGAVGEDGVGSTELDRNFPHQYPEAGEGAGTWALAASESRALVDWMLSRGDIEAVLVLGAGDSLFELPEIGKFDATNRAPLGLERGDAPFAEELKKKCEDAVGWKKSNRASIEGALWSWSYAQYGAMACSLDVTRQPARDAAAIAALSAPKPREGASDATPSDGSNKTAQDAPADDDAKTRDAKTRDAAAPAEGPPAKEESPEASKPEGKVEGKPEGNDGKKDAKKNDDPETALLEAAKTEGWGFHEWREFQHPELGRVEIGGLEEDFRRTPAPEAWPALGAQVGRIAEIFLARLPRLEVGAPTVEAVGDGVYRVRIAVTNVGGINVPTAIGEKLRRRGSVSLRLELPRDRVPSGRLVQTLRKLEAGGGEGAAEWLVLGKAGESIRITLRAPQLGKRELTATLGDGGAR
jgi:hypothetical protein